MRASRLSRAVVDTNVLISAVISAASPPGRITEAWLAGRFDMVSSDAQLAEFRRASRYPRVAALITPAEAGTLVRAIRQLAVMANDLAPANLSSDPNDDFLLAMAKAGRADWLVSGDKSGLLALGKVGRTRIVSARDFVDAFF